MSTAEIEKKTTPIPADVRNRVLRGDAPPEKKETETPPDAAAIAAKAKSDKEAADKIAADAAAAATADADKVTKKKKAAVPPIPAAPAPDLTTTVKEVLAAQQQTRAAPAAVTLDPEDERELELAKFAAEKHDDKYKGLPERIGAWYLVRDRFLADKAKELGGQKSQEFKDFLASEELRDFVNENRPAYNRGDRERIKEEFIEERGARRARKEFEPEIEAVKLKQKEMELGPVIQKTVVETVRVMLTDSAEQPDPALVEFCKDPVAFNKANRREALIVAKTSDEYMERAQETLRITNGLAQLNGQLTPTQEWISGFVSTKEKELERMAPDGLRMDDGKILVSTGQFAKLKAAKADLGGYRQFTPHELVGMIAVEGQAEIKRKLVQERKELEESGYVRKPAANVEVAKPAQSEVVQSPLSTSSRAPGASEVKPSKSGAWFEQYIKG